MKLVDMTDLKSVAVRRVGSNPAARTIYVGVLLLNITGCIGWEHEAGDLGKCYISPLNSFCVVSTPPNTTLSTGTGIVPGVAAAAGGLGSLMIGQGAIINGAATIVSIP